MRRYTNVLFTLLFQDQLWIIDDRQSLLIVVYSEAPYSQWRNNEMSRVGKVQGAPSAGASNFQAKF